MMSKENLEGSEEQVPQVSADERSQDLEAGASGDWAEDSLQASSDPPPLLSLEDHVDVPDALTHLEGVGFRFMRIPDENWKLMDNNARVFKNCSVTFSVDTVCTSQDIIFGFDKAGIDIDEITSIQRRNSSRSWVVSFKSSEHKDAALEISSITICGCEVFLGDAENKTVIVKIYEAPSELPDTVLIGRLSTYGKILSFRRDLLATNVWNGVRTARMRLSRPIPSSMRIVGELVLFYYESQPRTCRRCGGSGHMANGCKEPRCFNCDKAGHRAEKCPDSEMCNVCFSSEHFTARCPFILYSANVQPRVEGQGTASFAAAVQDRPQQANTSAQRAKSGDDNRKPITRDERDDNKRQRARDDQNDNRKRQRKDDRESRNDEDRRERRSERREEREPERERDRNRGCDRGSGRGNSRQGRGRGASRDRDRDHDRDRRDRDSDRRHGNDRGKARMDWHSSDDDSDWITVRRRGQRRERSRS